MDDKNGKNRGLDSLVIDEATYKNLKKMLNSSKDDQVVALQCIRLMNKQRNYVAVAFLRKDTNCPTGLWEQNCKTHMKYHLSLGIPENNNIPFSSIWKAMQKEEKYKQENGKFFTARYVEFLKENLVKMDFVESIEMTVKIKGYEY